jgi:hypothetical protein
MPDRQGSDVVAQKWETPRGKLLVWLPAPTIVAHQFTGHLDVELTRLLIGTLNKMVERRGQLTMFNDWEGMRGYDSEARVQLTQWVRSIHDELRGVHILVRDKLVGMGVSVANLSLGGILKSYTDRVAWERALQDLVAEGTRGTLRPPKR